jgi:amino acid adenylation domain-containing protein
MQTSTTNPLLISEQISGVRDNFPHSVALSWGDRTLSYQELDRRANQFAAHLARRGIVSGGTVAICMERSFDWIVAALGIMRASAAYVPLDSAWPDSRLRFAVKDSGATVLVAREALLDRLQVRAHGIDPRRDATAIAAMPSPVPRPAQHQSLAYVIYTSGSTGVPKGVEITHANLSHLIGWHRSAFNVTRQDRASHLAGLGFDAAVWEIWPHLAAGATVCLASDGARSSPKELQQWIIRERVTLAFVPTVYAEPMIAMDWPGTTALRLLLTGGDVLRRAPGIQLPFDVVNNYGPTECTVVATSALLTPGSPGAPPIGLPIAGADVYLLNDSAEQVPEGSIGEIYIGGNGVGRGYRNLPDSTRRRFMPDPFSSRPGARMYRTGDRGVKRPDGNIEFRGRLDRQTKIRGQRVELDEIASVLIQHPSIDFATAITNIEDTGDIRLVAYVLPKTAASVPTVHELQNHLRRRLPDYMIPDVFVRLQALPLSANGKLDLARLPKPTESNLLQGLTVGVPPAPIKERLLAMVRVLLENDAVQAEDSFFLAGGHSLLGMQLVMRVRTAFGVDLTLRQLFEAPTVERLALLIETKLEEERLALDPNGPDHEEVALTMKRNNSHLPDGVLALQHHESRQSIFWIHDLSVELAKGIGEVQPFFSVVLTPDDFLSLGDSPALQQVAACLLRKIQAAQPKGPYTIGGFCLGGLLAYEIASQLRAAGHEVSHLVLLDPPNPRYIESCDSLTRKASYLRYALKRAVRLGPRLSLVYSRDHLGERFGRAVGRKSAKSEMKTALQTAALAYRPEIYQGRVLLILASEHPPHVNLLRGWQDVVPHNLTTRYVDGHHRDVLKDRSVPTVTDVIVSYLTSVTPPDSLSLCADTHGPRDPMQTADATAM